MTFYQCTHLIKYYFNRSTEKLAHKSGLSKADLNKVKEYFHENIGNSTPINDLAKMVDLNCSHFIRQFKISTGCSPYQYKKKLIVQKAKQMLLKTDKKIIDIACELGYENPSKFSSSFKKIMNMTPSEFRKSVIR